MVRSVSCGDLILGSQELAALCRRLRIDIPKREFEITLLIDEVTRMRCDGEDRIGPFDGYDVYHWPEFKTFCKVWGIAYEFYTKDITVRIVEGEQPYVIHKYALVEQEVDESTVVVQ